MTSYSLRDYCISHDRKIPSLNNAGFNEKYLMCLFSWHTCDLMKVCNMMSNAIPHFLAMANCVSKHATRNLDSKPPWKSNLPPCFDRWVYEFRHYFGRGENHLPNGSLSFLLMVVGHFYRDIVDLEHQ